MMVHECMSHSESFVSFRGVSECIECVVSRITRIRPISSPRVRKRQSPRVGNRPFYRVFLANQGRYGGSECTVG